ncbi:MAG: acyl-CoA thioesterase [Acidobacteria bacterium]|nr:acyl-CoA thioesterase [Acidobacteriota bacterium]
MLLITHRLQVRFRDCDPLGHVNNAVYLTYLEQARFNLWRAQLGFQAKSAADAGPRGIGFILARVECDFRAQAKYGDDLDVKLSLGEFGRSSFTYTYEIVNATTGQLMAGAKTVLVWFDYDAQKPTPIGDETKARLRVPV